MTKRRKILTSLIPSLVFSMLVVLTGLSKHPVWYVILGFMIFNTTIISLVFWIILPPLMKEKKNKK